MLREFTGESHDFENWRQQVEVLRNTYQLDDNAVKILINLRLKGEALKWCQSKPSHFGMSATRGDEGSVRPPIEQARATKGDGSPNVEEKGNLLRQLYREVDVVKSNQRRFRRINRCIN